MNAVAARPSLHVAAGVVVNHQGEVLIAKRPEHLHQGGLWEFPGGKVESGESVGQALIRELQEELAITVRSAEPLITIFHGYTDRDVILEVLRVDWFEGSPVGMEGQPLRWVRPDDLWQYRFPAANRAIVTAARLPERYGFVDIAGADAASAMPRLQVFADAGISLIRLRAKMLSDIAYQQLAEQVMGYCATRKIKVLLSCDPSLAVSLGAEGVHLDAAQMMQLSHRPIVLRDKFLAVSCHSAQELQRAESIGADFAVLSPVMATESHPEASPLGWQAFAEMVSRISLPVYALGGMCPEHVQVAKCHGGQGIAGIRRLAAP